MVRLTIALSEQEYEALLIMADRDLRFPKEHIRHLIRRAAEPTPTHLSDAAYQTAQEVHATDIPPD
jgi:hypothetical protein